MLIINVFKKSYIFVISFFLSLVCVITLLFINAISVSAQDVLGCTSHGGCEVWTCFPAGTGVDMEGGQSKNIEDVEVGDRVVSQDEQGNKSVSTVTKLDQPVRDHMCQINYTDGKTLRLTDEHPLYTEDGWKSINPDSTYKDVPDLPVTALQKGDKVAKSDGGEAEVDYFGCWSESVQTYNLILDGGVNTYFADGYLAHNKDGYSCPIPGQVVYLGRDLEKCDPICWWDDWGENLICSGQTCSFCFTANGCNTYGGWPVSADPKYNCKEGKVNCKQFWCDFPPGPTPGPTAPPTPAPTAAPNPSCTLSLAPGSGNVAIGGTTSFTAAVNPSNGSVDRVTFSTSNSSIGSISPNSDNSSPYRTTATGVAPGTVTITARAVMGGVNRCSDTSRFTVAVPPQCSVPQPRDPPATTCGDPGTVTWRWGDVAGVNQYNLVIQQFSGGSWSTVRDYGWLPANNANFGPGCNGDAWGDCIKTESRAPGTYRSRIRARNTTGICTESAFSTSPQVQISDCVSCTVDLLPSSTTVGLGNDTSFSVSVTPLNGTIDRVDFSSANSAIASVSPDSDSTPFYSTVATGNSLGSTIITSNVIMGGATTCSDTSSISVEKNAWWQVVDGDVVSTGDISSQVPLGDIFDDDGIGGYPGVPIYNGTLDVNSRISSKSWSASTSTSSSKVYNYTYFESLVPEDVVFYDPASTSMADGGVPQYGYYWFKTNGNYNINSNLNLGDRKVILFVGGSNLNIRDRISLNDGFGFFMAISDGDISVDGGVSGTPSIEGLFVSDGVFSTGSGNSPLHIRGSVAAYGGIDMTPGRDLADNTPPAEIFEYAPDQILLFPQKLATRKTRWNEISP